MFNRNFQNFLNKKPKKEELYPYLYAINFKGLIDKKTELKIKPIQCSTCGAILTNIELIKESEKIGTHYKCEFCESINVIEKSEIFESISDDIDFILEDIQKRIDDKVTSVNKVDGELYIAIIDISGSMSGGKIEAVKKSLIQTIKDFEMNSPHTKFVLIAFESSVYYYLQHDQSAVNFSGKALYNMDMMRNLFNSVITDPTVGSIGEFADNWISKVEDLRSMDMTALGPAMFFGVLTFEKLQANGRITLLTDGLANQGIGNLSGTSSSSEEFYDYLADLCNQLKIIVDVVGVSSSGDNNEMGLQTLGKITDKTGGNMFLISSKEMEAIFSELRSIDYVGRDVNVKIITPKNINIGNITGAYSSKGNLKESKFNLGAVTGDRELYVQLESVPEEIQKMEEVPIQLQVEYTDKEGRKHLRVVSDRVKVIDNENTFKANYDQKLNAMYNIQMAGTDYYSGKADKSKHRLKLLKEKISYELQALQGREMKFAQESFSEGLSYLDDELEEMEEEEEKIKKAPAASFMAYTGQIRSRKSLNLKKRQMNKKKQK
ncbi:MAG: hypothetical protein ACTSR8_10855 [Promethearchaeota archaeon]